jgi:lysozyme family protein
MDVRDFIRGFIAAHEGGLSIDPVDTGNWFYEKGCDKVLVGSKYGCTGAALAAHRKCTHITPDDMAKLTLDEAVDVGVSLYYDQPDMDLLPWNQVTASILDMGWGAGTGQAIKLMQRMIVVADDGQIGPHSARAYAEFVDHHGIEEAAEIWAGVRNSFYDAIIKARPANAKYRNGWRNRTASFLPGTAWWKAW